MKSFLKKKVIIALSLTAIVSISSADSWPEFRGPTGDGIAAAENIPEKLDESSNLVWKTDLPGRGWSSPVFDGTYLWVTAAEEIFPDEEERIKILESQGEEAKKFKVRQVAKSIKLSAIQVDFESGKLLQTVPLIKIDNPQTIHALNSFASPTPVLKDGKLYAHFGAFGTFCIDTTSREVDWERKIEIEHSVGPGSSPFIYEDKLILICDGTDRQFVTALDIKTGETAWLTERPEMRAVKGDQKKSYNTPVLIEDGGTPQIICLGAQWLISYAPDTGDELWRLDHGAGFSIVPRPVYSPKHKLLYFSTGFGKPVLIAVKVDGKGDITDSDKIAWKESKRIPARPSPLLIGDELYVIADGGVTTCLNAATGETYWNDRIDGNYSASPLFADGKIFVASHEGVITVFKPGTTFSPLSETTLEGSIMASPIAVNEALLIRSEQAIYRFGN
ncbi:PQQ-binding-like beta-propeller repeat protein [Verrucomicrobiales bacterium]|nr:PQQ-binding-like beta-propeller repeat protein [Verrucomicrobiales bacterium]